MMDLPALGGPADLSGFDGTIAGGYSNLISGQRGDVGVVVFDYRTEAESPYSKPHWQTCVAALTGLECPQLIVQPQPSRSPRGGSSLHEMTFESALFDEQYRVLTADPKFASAFIDARVIASLLDEHMPWTFEVAGRWAAITSSELPPDRLEEAIEALLMFRRHIPRVMDSLYPPPGPHFV
jgi:hypothetical protein